MKYPCVKPWLKYHRISESKYKVDNDLAIGAWDAEPTRFSSDLVVFMQRLDGKTDPYSIDDTLPRTTVREYLQVLKENGFLRDKRRNRDLGRFVFPIVLLNGKTTYSRLAVVLNRLLMVLWLPALIGGIIAGRNTVDRIVFSDSILVCGIGLGLVCGTLFHEIAHLIAARAYMAPVYELGFALRFIPSAYNHIAATAVKHRLRRTQIYAAGIEMNFLLAGVFGLLSLAFKEAVQTVFFYAAIQNLGLGVISLSFFFSFDGFKMITTLLGADDMLFSMISTWVCLRMTWEEQKERGAVGVATMACVVVMSLTQLLPLVYLLYVIAEVAS